MKPTIHQLLISVAALSQTVLAWSCHSNNPAVAKANLQPALEAWCQNIAHIGAVPYRGGAKGNDRGTLVPGTISDQYDAVTGLPITIQCE
jgi:hypothetical protein